MKKVLLVLLFAVVGIAAAQAQTNQNTEYERLMNQALAAQGTESMLEKTLNDNFQSLVADGTLTKEKCAAMSKEIAKAFTPDVENAVKSIWRKNLSLDELRQVVKWCTSPIGQKLIKLQTIASSEMQSLMTSPAMQQRIMEIVKKYI